MLPLPSLSLKLFALAGLALVADPAPELRVPAGSPLGASEHGRYLTGAIVYSPMRSGLLTDRSSEERVRSLRDGLRPIAERHHRMVAQVAIGWTLAWNGVTAAIVGARAPE